MCFCRAVLALGYSATLLGQTTGSLAMGRFSSVPLYPKDGNVSVCPGQYVFVRPSESDYVVTYLPNRLEANRGNGDWRSS
jgi:hypothetical protein